MGKILETKNLCKFFGGVKAVNEVDIQIEEKSVFGIIGPNGAGKTTFFNLLSGMLDSTSGKIIYKNEDITKFKPQKVTQRGISRTFQNIKLFEHMTVHENVKIGFHTRIKTNFIDAVFKTNQFKNDEAKVNELGLKLLERVNMKDKKNDLAKNLSYGDKRRLEIARALAADPDMLLVDEPAAGMNANETKSVIDLLKKLNDEGITIVVIEHDMSVIMSICDEIAVLNNGIKIAQDIPGKIRKDKKVIDAYLGSHGENTA